jgi:catechol 2,3-dioxygenase-like lactoylglutathione lyase family enzyme
VTQFQGFDHVDTRVRSLLAVEPFYDRLMAELGLPRKKRSFVDDAGDWHELKPGQVHNVAEYFEEPASDRPSYFIGFIEDPRMIPTRTRIAFRVSSRAEVERWNARLPELGAVNVELSADMDAYAAVFFEDPAGTLLEIVARMAAN